MVNAADLKSAAAKAACGFKPRPRHRELFGISPARERLGQGVDDRPGPIRVLHASKPVRPVAVPSPRPHEWPATVDRVSQGGS